MHSNLPYKPLKLFQHKHWQQCYVAWLAHLYQRSESMHTVREYQYKVHQIFQDPTRTPDTYTTQEIEEYLRNTVDKRQTSAYTHNSRLGIIKSFYAYASQYEIPFRRGTRMLMHKRDPAKDIRQLPTEPVNRTLTEDEIRRLFSAIPRDTLMGIRDRAIISFYLLTGRRLSEVIQLKWGDLEQIHGTWIYHFKGKGHRARDDRDVLPPRVMQAINAYLVASERERTIQPEDPLFLSRKGDRHALTKSGVEKRIRKYALAAGLHLSCHWFRHTHAYDLWIATDKDILKVAKRLRHKSVEQTRRYLEAAEVLHAPELNAIEAKYRDL